MTEVFKKISKVLATSLNISADELYQSFNRATKTDIAAVCELMRLGFGDVENLTPAVIAWRYFDFSAYDSDLFVLRYEGRIIAAVGAEPIRVKVGDLQLPGIRAGDIVVHPDFMKGGIGAWMNLYLQNHFSIVMAMGANENSTSMVRRIFKPMNCRHHLKILFSTKHYLEFRGWSPLIIKTTSLLTFLPLALIRLIFFKMLPSGYSVEVVNNTDNFHHFFASPEYQPRSINMALRSAEYCRWRYDLNPKSHFKFFEMYKKNRLLGYAIVKQNGLDGSGGWQLMDWDLLPHLRNKKQFRFLFSAVTKWVAEQGADSLSVMASDSLSIDSLFRTGFSHRALEDGFYLWVAPGIDTDMLDEKKWFLSFADTDEAL